MHLAQRAYILALLTAVLAIAGLWSRDPLFAPLWHIPAGLLLIGLAVEAFFVRRAVISADVETPPRGFLGRTLGAAFVFRNGTSRRAVIEFMPALPDGFEPLAGSPPGSPPESRRVIAPAFDRVRVPLTVVPVRLGRQSWPALPARLLGPLGVAWWSLNLQPSREIAVAPDTHGIRGVRPRGNPGGARPRRTVGAGSELHQLRGYVPGDPLARIDWKATARARKLVSREFNEDQHLDIMLAVDAGRFSRACVGRLDRFGLYANVAARFAEIVTPNDDRVGLLVFSDRPLAVCAPSRGLPAVVRVRRALEGISLNSGESDLVGAAVRIRGMLKHRSLVVLLTDCDDSATADRLTHAVRLLSPPHLVVIATVQSSGIAELARMPAREWNDPWISLAAQEHEARARGLRILLQRLGAPVVMAPAQLLERTVIAEYERLRRARRV